jgi:hypothetical protein
VTPPRERKGTAGPAKAPPLQPRPAARAQQREQSPEGFPPNPVVARKSGPEQPRDRAYRVVGPKAVGGVLKPGTVVLSLTDSAAAALEAGGHVEPYTPDESLDDGRVLLTYDQDEPTAGTDQEGN